MREEYCKEAASQKDLPCQLGKGDIIPEFDKELL